MTCCAAARLADHLFGGLGTDVFDFDSVADSAPGSRDIIRGGVGIAAFEGAGVAGGDLIDLSGIDANTAAAGNQAFVIRRRRHRAGLAGRLRHRHRPLQRRQRRRLRVRARHRGRCVLASAYRSIDFVL